MDRSRLLGAAAVCVLATSLTTGCGSSTSGKATSTLDIGAMTVTASASATPRASRSASGARPRAATPAELGATLTSIALKKTDLARGYSLHLIPGGSKVTGQVTLDNCGYHFTTESHRVARRQYTVLDPTSGNTGLSNELVAYDTAAHAALAIAQWYASARACPHKPVRSTVAGVPDLTYTVSVNKIDVAGFPAKLNVVTEESARPSGKIVLYDMAILQVHGRYLDAVYLTGRTPIPSRARIDTEGFAIITGRRLAALK